jgi:hypothetical protein
MRQRVFWSFMLFAGTVSFCITAHAAENERRPPETAHLHLKRGEARPGSNHRASPLLNYNGGAVLHAPGTAVIFWGASWNNATFAGDKIAGIDGFFTGFGGSSLAHTGTEYSDKTGYVSTSSVYAGHLVDASAPPAKALSTSGATAEVCKLTANNPDPNSVYFIYTSTGAGNVNYCAWHTWGTCSNGAKVQVAYIPNLDGIAGCDPEDQVTGNSQGLAAIANVTSHELMESITDPRGQGWFDSSGEEDGDKCAWSFPAAGSGISTLYGGAQFKLQMEWSNAAYSTGTGQSNLSGQKGCIY